MAAHPLHRFAVPLPLRGRQEGAVLSQVDMHIQKKMLGSVLSHSRAADFIAPAISSTVVDFTRP